jgi:hypothetical protein
MLEPPVSYNIKQQSAPLQQLGCNRWIFIPCMDLLACPKVPFSTNMIGIKEPVRGNLIQHGIRFSQYFKKLGVNQTPFFSNGNPFDLESFKE